MENHVPVVVPCLSRGASSSSTAIPPATSSPRDSSKEYSTQRPVKRRTKEERSLTRKNTSLDLRNKRRNLGRRDIFRDLQEWLGNFIENLVEGEASFSLRQCRSWFFGAAPSRTSTMSWSRETLCIYASPKKTKLRSMRKEQNCKGSLDKALRRSHTPRRKCWWLDNCRPQDG